MNQNEKETAKRIQTLAVCGCLCLLAVGAGVTYRALDRGTAAQPQLEPNPQPCLLYTSDAADICSV